MKCFVVITLALGSLLATAPVALAQGTNCDFSSSSFTTVEGNLVVPNNATCMLLGSGTVSGNVTVGENAGLALEGNWTIGGYLQASNCAYVSINPFAYGSTVVGRNVQIENCSGNSPALGRFFPAGAAFGSFGPNSLIGVDFKCNNNTGPCILVHDHVGGNVYVIGNKSSAPSQIDGNFIAKGLHCLNNLPAPTGSSNLAAGIPGNNSEGQCQGF
ncbi:MAG: hypothetical protein WA383_19030 [Terriglobales bacterium]